MEDLIRKWVLQNAVKYEGKAQQGAIIGKLISENSDIKNNMKDVVKLIAKVIKDVNALSLDKQMAELQAKWPELLVEKPVEEKVLKDLPDAVQGKVVLRVAPSPSGPLHIGHAYITCLNSEYAKKYGGKLILRIEDTNPENIFSPAYKLIEEDVRWLTNDNVHSVPIQSDRLHTYYDYAEKLLNMEKAYVCTCDADVFRTLIAKKEACLCRNVPVKEQLLRWDKMFTSYEPGQAVVRIKTDVAHPNPAMRDWPALRINHAKHPRTGTEEKVWPLMNFAVAVDDHEMGVTHTIRGKDHMDNAKRQKYIFDFFGWKVPVHKYVGRINFEGIEVSKTKTKLAIERGEYEGWDDIRLPFLCALKRRGYQSAAFTKWAVDIGLTETDKTVAIDEFFKTLNHFNKEILDPVVNRYFFVWDPVKISIEGAPAQQVSADLHPSDPSRGKRVFTTSMDFFISRDDFGALKENGLYRLMHCLNFTKKGGNLVFVSKEHKDFEEKGDAIMHWLPVDQTVNVCVLMPDHSEREGVGEQAIANLPVGANIQFERFGFCRLDNVKQKTFQFWFGCR
ncbi:glutamate--tRNA ligase [Candidatus Woesearchaeota archaeon]|nr:glutamate--tRNA ligase [Candidatus Woesearchaeota archaeon]